MENKNASHISVNTQYIKDFSFENPDAPASMINAKNPEIDLSLDLNVKKISDDEQYEVEITIHAKAHEEKKTLFIADLKYAGVFHLINIEEEQKEIVLAVHCPGILFPYARKIIADASQDGGFQPLMIDPIDFGMLYQKKLNEQETAKKN